MVSWQLTTWESAQAGNRASKTRRYLQWWDSKPEQNGSDLWAAEPAQLHLFPCAPNHCAIEHRAQYNEKEDCGMGRMVQRSRKK